MALDLEAGFALLLLSYFLVLLVSDFLALFYYSLRGDVSFLVSSLIGLDGDTLYFYSSLAGDSPRLTSSFTGLLDGSGDLDLLG